MHRSPHRTRALPAVLLAGAVALSGCGSDEPPAGTAAVPSSPSGAGGSTTEPAPASGTELTVTVRTGGEDAEQTWTLRCAPDGGDHPDPAGACAALATGGATALDPVAGDTVCSQVFGGPQTAVVTGTRDGQQVDTTVQRSNGCEIARWNRLVPLVPAVS